jgi:hypothetical protein
MVRVRPRIELPFDLKVDKAILLGKIIRFNPRDRVFFRHKLIRKLRLGGFSMQKKLKLKPALQLPRHGLAQPVFSAAGHTLLYVS